MKLFILNECLLQKNAGAKMSCETDTIETVRNSDQRMTPQRLLLLSAIRHSGEHININQIHAQVKKAYPFINVSTIYRNVAILKELRLISETYKTDGETLYEWIGDHTHMHMMCRDCNDMIEIDDKYLDSFKKDIRDDFGFNIDIDHLAISGLCKPCKQLEQVGYDN